ncbi:hypothetical protein ACHHYP_11548 [Achlya hypogyna]|uniref:Uncharacterized protein n=1 Tax=Achlya hypogyna TaxID=1202772 RepID=A0A1V9ZHI7_ACHHY|nr:hypothetical protein ACHHYP_11548 [Achlya hypogyna]
MPASLDTISTVPAPVFDRPVHSNDNNSPAMYNYGDEDAVLPGINTYFNDFTFDVDADVTDVDAAAILLVGLEYLKNLFMGSQPKTT